MKYLNFATEFKAAGDSGKFEGYAAIFGNVDLGMDLIKEGAYKEFAYRKNGKIVVLNNHRIGEPIGLAEVSQDSKGLAFSGELILDLPIARSTHALMKAGVVDEMSMGYDVLPGGAKILESGVRELTALKLWEISPVTFAMNPQAGIDAVKSIVREGVLPSLKEFEDFLREAGFSNTQAKAVAGNGLRKLLDRCEADGNTSEALKMLSDFTI